MANASFRSITSSSQVENAKDVMHLCWLLWNDHLRWQSLCYRSWLPRRPHAADHTLPKLTIGGCDRPVSAIYEMPGTYAVREATTLDEGPATQLGLQIDFALLLCSELVSSAKFPDIETPKQRPQPNFCRSSDRSRRTATTRGKFQMQPSDDESGREYICVHSHS